LIAVLSPGAGSLKYSVYWIAVGGGGSFTWCMNLNLGFIFKPQLFKSGTNVTGLLKLKLSSSRCITEAFGNSTNVDLAIVLVN